MRRGRRLGQFDAVDHLERVRVHRDELRVRLLHALGGALDDRHRALQRAALGSRLVLQDQRAVGRDRQMLVVDVRRRRGAAGQRVVLQDLAAVAVDQHDLVRPGEGDVAVRQDVEVGVADPVARCVQVVEVGAPDLLAGGRVDLGEVGPGHVRVLQRRVLAADDVELARLAVVHVRDARIVVGAAPGVDAVRSVERAEETGAGEEPAALGIGDLGAVERGVIARRLDFLLACQLLCVQAHIAGQWPVGGDLVRRQPDLGGLLLDLGTDERPAQAPGDDSDHEQDCRPCQFEHSRFRHGWIPFPFNFIVLSAASSGRLHAYCFGPFASNSAWVV